VTQLPELSRLGDAEKDALIRALWAQVQSLEARVMALEARLGEPSKTPDNSSYWLRVSSPVGSIGKVLKMWNSGTIA
jgi:hypothetical protein